MKFKSLDDKKMFLLEIGKMDLFSIVDDKWEPSNELVELFIKKRRDLIPKMKDFRRSQTTKQSWRHNRHGYMKGIKKYHSSTSGKRMHRSLGRFLSTNDFEESYKKLEGYELVGLADLLKAISSSVTHMFIESEYFMPTDEQINYESMVEHIVPKLLELQKKIMVGSDLTSEDIEMIAIIADPESVINEIQNNYNVKKEDILLVYEKLSNDENLSMTEVYNGVISNFIKQ